MHTAGLNLNILVIFSADFGANFEFKIYKNVLKMKALSSSLKYFKEEIWSRGLWNGKNDERFNSVGSDAGSLNRSASFHDRKRLKSPESVSGIRT